MTSRIKLNTEQQRAVETIEGPVLVLAGPGTGKTQLLSARVANILQKTDINPQNILCLTYTEAGVTAMKERLGNTIGQSGYQVSVHTFHSFALEVMRRFPDYFLDIRGFQPIDELTSYQILEEILAKLPLDFKLAHRTFARENRISELVNKISELKKAGLDPDSAKHLAQQNQKDLNDLSELLSLIPSDIPRAKAQIIKLIEDLVTFLQNQTTPEATSSPVSTLKSVILSELSSATALALENQKSTPITEFKNNHLEKNLQGGWRFKDLRYNQNLKEVAHIYSLYQKELVNSEKLEFEDMILNLLKAIKENEDLKLNIQEKWQYILVDEFQDTNFSQLEIVRLLGDNPSNLGQPNIMVVGDDDQAIYAFQGASVSNIQSFLNIFPESEVITLQENYRSTKNILSASLESAKMIQERPEGTTAKELHGNTPDNNTEVEVVSLTDSNSELNWLCTNIKKQIQNGTKPEDIAILAPKHKYLQELAKQLQVNDVPVYYETSSNILEDDIIQELLSLSKLVIKIGEGELAHSNSLLAEVLSAPYWQLELGSIWKLAVYASKSEQKKHWLEHLSAGALEERGKQIYKQIISWSSQTNQLSLEQMLDKLIGATEQEDTQEDLSQFKQYYFSEEKLKNEPALYANFLSSISSLRDHLRTYYPDQSRTKLKDLIDYVQLCEQHGGIRLTRRGLHIKPSGVNLITAYGSKGLEFEQVYLMHCLEDVWTESARGRNDTLKFSANFASHKDSSDDRTRLFYVAQTRAKNRLVHTYYSFDEKGKKKSMAHYLHPLLESKIAKITDLSEDVLIAEESANNYQQKLFNEPEKQAQNTVLADILKPILENYRLSATHLTTWLDPEYGGESEFITRHLLRFPQAMNESAVHGSAVHKAMELAQLKKNKSEDVDKEDLINFYSFEINKCSLEEEVKLKLIEKAKYIFNKFYDQIEKLLEGENLSEVDIKANFGEIKLSGKLDVVVINKKDKTAIIRDYKTGKPTERIGQNYKYQLYLYKLLLDCAPERLPKDVRLESAELIYLSPAEEEIVTLKLNYDQNEYEEFKELIKKVWSEIMHLGIR